VKGPAFLIAALSLTLGVSAVAPGSAAAITAELAKKCRRMMVEAYPNRPAGSRTGVEQAQREYFKQCIASNGRESNSDKDQKNSPEQGQK
jgi:hypothetical protein